MRAHTTLLLSLSTTALSVLPVYLVGGLAPMIRSDLELDLAGIGAAVSTFYSAATLASLLTRHWGRRLGAERVMTLGSALSTFALIAVGTIATSWLGLVAVLAFAGAANALVQPAASALIARDEPSRHHGLTFGVLQSAIPATTLLVGLTLPVIDALDVDWRIPFLIAGILQAPLVVLSLRLRTRASGARVPQPGAASARRPGIAPLILLTIIGALVAAPANALGSYYVESAIASGHRPAAAGAFLVLGSIVGILSRLLWGWAVDRNGTDPRVAMAWLLLGGTIGFGGMILSASPPIMILATLLAFGAGWAWKGLYHLSAVQHAPDAVSSVVGTAQIGLFAGSIVGPAAFGLVTQQVSYAAAWLCSAGLFVLAMILLLIQRRLGGSGPGPAETLKRL